MAKDIKDQITIFMPEEGFCMDWSKQTSGVGVMLEQIMSEMSAGYRFPLQTTLLTTTEGQQTMNLEFLSWFHLASKETKVPLVFDLML